MSQKSPKITKGDTVKHIQTGRLAKVIRVYGSDLLLRYDKDYVISCVKEVILWKKKE